MIVVERGMRHQVSTCSMQKVFDLSGTQETVKDVSVYLFSSVRRAIKVYKKWILKITCFNGKKKSYDGIEVVPKERGRGSQKSNRDSCTFGPPFCGVHNQ